MTPLNVVFRKKEKQRERKENQNDGRKKERMKERIEGINESDYREEHKRNSREKEKSK